MPETAAHGLPQGAGAARLRVAVTGASGQLGTLLLRRLIDDRDIASIVAVDLKPPALVSRKLEAVQMDVRAPDLERVFAGCDTVIHLAFVVSDYLPRPLFDSINIDGSRSVFRAAVAAQARHILCASSMAAYGILPGHPVPITEQDPRRYQPDFPYAAAKYQVEALLDDLERANPALIVTRFRPVMMLGRRMNNPMGRMLSRRVLLNVDTTWLPLVWDEDVADAFMLALKRRVGGAFNLASGEPATVADLATATGTRMLTVPRGLAVALARSSPYSAKLRLFPSFDPAWIRHGTVRMVTSSEKARSVLGWQPRCRTAVEVLQRYFAATPRNRDRAILAFMRLLGAAGRFGPRHQELRGVQLDIHLCLTGRGGGDFGIVVRDGRLLVLSRPPLPAMATVTLSAELFRAILAGRMEWSRAVLTGQVRSEGQGHAPMLIAGLISSFHARMQQKGLQRWVTRLFIHWLNAGARP